MLTISRNIFTAAIRTCTRAKQTRSYSQPPKKSNSSLSGVFAPIPTCFDKKGDLAIKDFKYNISRFNKTKLDGLVIMGSNGEFPYLSFKEKKELLKAAKEATESKMLIAGTGSTNFRETLELNQYAKELGYDAVMVITPYYFLSKMNDATLEAYYSKLADAVDIPLILYNMPSYSGINMSVSVVSKLSTHKNIFGIKDTSNSINQTFSYHVETKGNKFDVLAGSGTFFLHGLMLGCTGGVLALANIVPNTCREIYEMSYGAEHHRAVELQNHVTPLNEAITSKYGIPGMKYVMNQLGFQCGEARFPMPAVSDKEKAALDQLIDKYADILAWTKKI